jgi:predicted nucleotidyltransferase
MLSDDTKEGMSREPSGRFVLRIEPGLHAALREAAEAAGTSLNEYCARKLAAPGVSVGGPAAVVMERVAAVFGGQLVGIVVSGSWARGEARRDSDVDVLVIVGEGVALRRSLYREWDASPLEWEGRRVEVHFVHLPGEGSRATGLWAEAAMDGLVLYERGFEVSRRLAAMRHRIVSGRLVRHWSNGQAYWVEAA